MKKLCCITNKAKTAKNEGEMMILTFFELYTVYIKRFGEFFFHLKSYKYLNMLLR